MSAEPAEPKIISDEDWKERVRAENAELDRGAAPGQAAPPETPEAAPKSKATPEPRQMPPADFFALIEMFSTQAMVGLGLIPHPTSGKSDPQLALARHFIDLLGVVESKTTGNLSAQESSLLTSTLHYLRMSYLELSKLPPGQ
jgi:hypothetical protein